GRVDVAFDEDAGIRAEQIDAAESGQALIHQSFNITFPGDVGGNRDGADFGGGSLNPCDIDVADPDRRFAFRLESPGAGFADSGRSAGDNANSVFNTHDF